MAYRVQISTDGLEAYVEAIESAFGGNVDYGQIIKTYGHEEVERQSPLQRAQSLFPLKRR